MITERNNKSQDNKNGHYDMKYSYLDEVIGKLMLPKITFGKRKSKHFYPRLGRMESLGNTNHSPFSSI